MPSTSPEWPPVAVQVARQGAIVLNAAGPLSGYARHRCSDLVAFYVDVDTKLAKVAGHSTGPASAPVIEFLPTADAGTDAEPTELAFSEYVGWSVFAATLYGDELAVVLYKTPKV